MLQLELWTLVPMVAVVFLKVPVTYAEEKSQRRIDEQNSDNYIITHYGREYYTPVPESEMQIHNNGYFTAEVTPVDPKTGQQLQPVQNLFVPLHVGYTLGTYVTNKDPMSVLQPGYSIGVSDEVVQPEESIDDLNNVLQAKETQVRDVELKNKIPKKFKNAFADQSAKKLVRQQKVVAEVINVNDEYHQQRLQNNDKRQIKRFAAPAAQQHVYYGNQFWPQQVRRVGQFYY